MYSSLLGFFFLFLQGNVNFTVSAEALNSQERCGNEVPVVPERGKKDTIIKSLLVEVSKPASLREHTESQKSGIR